MRPEIPLLNRDNIGLVAKFVPIHHLSREFVVATTHLLYNPKRNDVRQAQMQLFLAEIDKISYRKGFGYVESILNVVCIFLYLFTVRRL